jgi:tRNA/rRNA methyltransferase
MAGTDKSQVATLGGPAVILVNPQLGENIGTSARAMLNFGLIDLRIVNPRDGWPSERACAASSRADLVIDNVRVYETTQEAIADLQIVYAATARPRDMIKPEVTAREAAVEMGAAWARGHKIGVLFGAERHGLSNDDIVLAQKTISVPVNPAYASLNLAQAVLLVAYEWFQECLRDGARPGGRQIDVGEEDRPASNKDLVAMFEHLESELDAANFLKPAAKRPRMIRNIRNIFSRANLQDQEVRTMRGIIKSLAHFRTPDENKK